MKEHTYYCLYKHSKQYKMKSVLPFNKIFNINISNNYTAYTGYTGKTYEYYTPPVDIETPPVDIETPPQGIETPPQGIETPPVEVNILNPILNYFTRYNLSPSSSSSGEWTKV